MHIKSNNTVRVIISDANNTTRDMHIKRIQYSYTRQRNISIVWNVYTVFTVSAVEYY